MVPSQKYHHTELHFQEEYCKNMATTQLFKKESDLDSATSLIKEKHHKCVLLSIQHSEFRHLLASSALAAPALFSSPASLEIPSLNLKKKPNLIHAGLGEIVWEGGGKPFILSSLQLQKSSTV